MDLSAKALDDLETRMRHHGDPLCAKAADAMTLLREREENLRARSAAAGLDSSVCDYVRSVAKELFQGNCTFVIDDIDFMAATANWALLNGIPDELNPEILPMAKKAAQERLRRAEAQTPTDAKENA